MNGPQDYAELGELVFLCLSGAADRDQIARLEAWLTNDAEARRYYSEFLVIYAGLRQSPASLLGSAPADDAAPHPVKATILDVPEPAPSRPSEGADADLEPTRFLGPGTARDIERHARRQLEAFLDQQRREERRRRYEQFRWDLAETVVTAGQAINRLVGTLLRVAKVGAVLAVIALAGLIVGMHIYGNRVVATLTDSADAAWEMQPEEARLRCGWMRLEEGFAQITFKKGAEVILQAPCEFELCSSNAMFLQDGRMTAHVPKRATGFTVSTPTSRVVDFGTEFGVLTGGGRGDEVHVFDGSVRFKSVRRRRSTRWDQPLKKGQAATVDARGQVRVQALRKRPTQFVRALPDANESGKPAGQLNLAAIVGGGDGRGPGDVGRGIEPSTGAIVSTYHVSGDGKGSGYIETRSVPFVDGVFVPDGGSDPAVVSSTGLIFQGFPDTDGRCHRTVVNGAVFQAVPFAPHPGRLSDPMLGSEETPSIGMHANAGVTFDLERLRRAWPHLNVVTFRAFCGVSETVANYAQGDMRQKGTVGFWVLVDGRERFSAPLPAVPAQARSIAIPLEPRDRFLTLATTGAEGGEFCWAMFAKPVLELETK